MNSLQESHTRVCPLLAVCESPERTSDHQRQSVARQPSHAHLPSKPGVLAQEDQIGVSMGQEHLSNRETPQEIVAESRIHRRPTLPASGPALRMCE